MSYKYNVCIMLKTDNYLELTNNILTQGFEDEELVTFKNGIVYHHIGDFVTLNWSYVKWDEATNEVVEMIEQYIDMLNKNNKPFRYITIGELGEITDRKCYGDDEADIPVIASVYPKCEIRNNLKRLELEL